MNLKELNFKKLKLTLIAIFFVTISVYSQNGEQVDVTLSASHRAISKSSEMTVVLHLNIYDGWHINSDKPRDKYLIGTKINFESADVVAITSIKYPEAHDFTFSFSPEPVSVFEGKVEVACKLKIADAAKFGENEITVIVQYQACNNQSCMPPNTVKKSFTFNIVEDASKEELANLDEVIKTSSGTSQEEKTSEEVKVETDSSEENSLASQLESGGLLISLIIVFFGGLALNLTPCVYPLIPITIGYFGGQSEGSTKKLFMLGLFYILGMSITYSVVGVVTSLSGAVFGSLMQNPYVIIFIAAIFVVLSFSMFGMYELKMPDKWVMKAGGARSGIFGAFFMGLTMGIVAAPCIGPFVLGLVTYVGAKGDPFYGFIMFFTLSIGLGLPYLFLALFSGKLKNLPRSGMWMEAVKHIFGFLLIGMAIYFIDPILPKSVGKYLLPVYMIFAGLYLIFIDKLANNVKGFRVFKTLLSILIIFLGVFFLIPKNTKAPAWVKFEKQVYEQTLASNQKMIIDCYADWCIACKELDALTFSKDSIIKESENFKMLKVDMTSADSEISKYVKNKFNVKGLPTIIFIDSKGKEAKRVTGFLEEEKFREIMVNIK